MAEHRVWKYVLSETGETALQMPVQAKVLSAQAQYGIVTLWAVGDSSAPLETRRFFVALTNQRVPDDANDFYGTVLLDDGRFVVHVFGLRSESDRRREQARLANVPTPD